MKQLAFTGVLAALSLLPACKPPPTDDARLRAATVAALPGPSDPLPSPDTTGALWAESGKPLRLVYGVPGQPVQVALECLDPATPTARMRITRQAAADEDAGALLALIGNRRIGRLEVDATNVGGRRLWQGEALAVEPLWEALDGPAEATVTIPGAGLVKLNPSPLPSQLVQACRGPLLPVRSADPA